MTAPLKAGLKMLLFLSGLLMLESCGRWLVQIGRAIRIRHSEIKNAVCPVFQKPWAPTSPRSSGRSDMHTLGPQQTNMMGAPYERHMGRAHIQAQGPRAHEPRAPRPLSQGPISPGPWAPPPTRRPWVFALTPAPRPGLTHPSWLWLHHPASPALRPLCTPPPRPGLHPHAAPRP